MYILDILSIHSDCSKEEENWKDVFFFYAGDNGALIHTFAPYTTVAETNGLWSENVQRAARS